MIAEDLPVGAEEGGFVFGAPDVIGRDAADVFEFLFFDERVGVGGKVEGLPFVFFGIESDAIEGPRTSCARGASRGRGRGRGW